MHVYHSLGVVKAGEISLFVFTSSAHEELRLMHAMKLLSG